MRRLLVCLLAGIPLAGPLAAHDYPTHPLGVIAPFAPRSATDTTIRASGQGDGEVGEIVRMSGMKEP